MHMTILAVGRLKNSLSIPLSSVAPGPSPLKKRPIKEAERMAREGGLLLKSLSAIPTGSRYVIALDERGKTMRSTKFADHIQKQMDRGMSHIIFLIGGADGYDSKVKKQANMLLSLGDMTWPHMMARMMLTEQLYRASCILSGHPYHKD